MNSKVRGYIALAIGFIVFNIIAFVIPIEHNTTFWVVYAFTDVAFLAQIGIWKLAFFKAESAKSRFLGIPIVYVGSIYLVLQIIAFAFCLAIPTEGWVTTIICVAILGISSILMISGDIGREEINRVEQNVSDKTAFMKKLQVDIEQLVIQETDTAIKEKLILLAQKIRYSDPVSNAATRELESSISAFMDKNMQGYISMDTLDKIIALVEQRNNICKNNK